MALETSPAVSFTPSATKVPTPENYLGSADYDWLRQELPETYNKIQERYGSQELTGMIELQGKEIAIAADSVLWKEEDRLTQLGEGVARTADVFTLADHTFRPGEVIVARDTAGANVRQGRISSVTSTTFTALCGEAAGWTAIGTTGIVVFADTNEFLKGSEGMQESLNTKVTSFEQNLSKFKEMVKENRSNMASISWLDITGADGSVKHVWYFLNYANTEKRFKNAIESGLLNKKKWAGDLLTAGYQGSQGLFDAFREGNIYTGTLSTMAGVDSIIDRSNKQGGLSQQFMYGTTAFNSTIDDYLSAVNTTGLSWGMFDNNEKMALNLEFSGFKRGGYEFGKSRWRYVEAPTAQGSMVGAKKVHAIMFPSGSKSVYDASKGKQATLPLLHLRYKAYGPTNLKYEMSVFDWKNGTSTKDEIRTEFQAEQALVVLGRANTFIFQG